MCTHEVDIQNNAKVNLDRYDPTRTLTLRKAFVSASNKRFKALKKLIQQKVQVQDCFGLKRALNVNVGQQNIEYFMRWLKNAEYNTILDKPWIERYIRLAYERGIDRARVEMARVGINVEEVNRMFEDMIGKRALSNLPYHVDMLGSLYARSFMELEGITAEMNTQIVRILSEGVLQGDSPANLARKINSAVIETKQDLGLTVKYVTKTGKQVSYFISGRRRAEILARTETIRAHHLAMVQEYKRWGDFDVKVLAELSTAKDDRVCEICESLEGQVFTLEEAEGLIPVHPQCRCVILPVFEKNKK